MPNFKKYFKETPIDTIDTIGDFSKGSSFRDKKDRNIVTNDKAIQKIKNKWANSKHTYDMYFMNTKEAGRYREHGTIDDKFIKDELKLKDFKNNPDAITIIFTGNYGDKKIQVTPWILAHRFGHAIAASMRGRKDNKNIEEAWTKLTELVTENINPIFDNGYEYRMNIKKDGLLNYNYGEDNATREKILSSFFNKIGTMKSARDNKISRYFEFYYELLSQYILSNKIKFNSIPRRIPFGKMSWGKSSNGLSFKGTDSDLEYYNGFLENLADEYPAYADHLLGRCVGKVFLM